MYFAPELNRLYQYYSKIIKNKTYKYVHSQLQDFCHILHTLYLKKDPSALIEISNYHPDFIGVKSFEMVTRTLTIADIELTIARAYHFESWPLVLEYYGEFDWLFENAIDDLLFGRREELQEKITAHPYLLTARSSYMHKAGLIHYCGSNGVEIWRQRVPKNLVEITKMLIQHGADRHMTSQLYGGGAKVIGLIESSAHPYSAGIAKELIQLFQ